MGFTKIGRLLADEYWPRSVSGVLQGIVARRREAGRSHFTYDEYDILFQSAEIEGVVRGTADGRPARKPGLTFLRALYHRVEQAKRDGLNEYEFWLREEAERQNEERRFREAQEAMEASRQAAQRDSLMRRGRRKAAKEVQI